MPGFIVWLPTAIGFVEPLSYAFKVSFSYLTSVVDCFILMVLEVVLHTKPSLFMVDTLVVFLDGMELQVLDN